MMENKKHIDKIFKEKLSDFEVTPPPAIWQNIEKELSNEDDKRRVLPLWIRIGSAAAVALLLISTGLFYFKSSDKESTPVNNTTPIVLEKDVNENVLQQKDDINAVVNSNTKATTINKSVKNPANANKVITSTTKKVAQKTKTNDENVLQTTKNTQSLIAKTEKTNKEVNYTKDTINSITKLVKPEDNEAIVAQTNAQKDINEQVKENLTETHKEMLENQAKWSVGSTVAPVFYNTLSNGSPIDRSLASNAKSSNTSMSYGLKINYAVNNKLTIQSGVSNINLSYKTKNVSAQVYSKQLSVYSKSSKSNIKSSNNISISSAQLESKSSKEKPIATINGDLDQLLSYVEVPLEAKYAIVNKKVGIHFVGGVSTYLLYKNNLYLDTKNQKNTLGEASNINTLNFSGNLGLDLDYKITEAIYINMSPMFKYQFNTYSKNDGGFKPYYLGVYTGLNYRF